MQPDFFRSSDTAQATLRIAGTDEVGRGPLAGPVVAAAVILPEGCAIAGLTDSKKITARKRTQLAEQIRAETVWALGWASVEEIDRLNILQASLLAMKRAVEGLAEVPAHVLVDGNQVVPGLQMGCTAVVGGDATEAAISAASILAKVTRDQYMSEQDQIYPGYGFARHAGYPTAAHMQALKTLGVTPIHRRSFRPVRALLEEAEG